MRVPTEFMFQQQLSMLSKQYENVARLSIQQSNGKKLLSPSDDPVLSNRINITNEILQGISSYEHNTIIAKNRSQLFESSLEKSVSSIDEINQLIIKANNDTLSDSERKSIAEQLKGFLNTLVNTANTRDGNGDYIFSGFNVESAPYINTGGSYQYQGSHDKSYLNIGDQSSVLYGESGYDVFSNMLNGNGRFTITASSTNTGSAFTTAGSVTDNQSYVADSYSISFVTNADGKLAYTVTGATTGQVLPPPPQSIPDDAIEFKPDSDINFNGITFHVSGSPEVGDTFTVNESSKENVFDALQGLIDRLQTPVQTEQDKANLHQELNQFKSQFNTIQHHFVEYRASVGTRMQSIENQASINNSLKVTQSAILSQLSDVDLAKVASDLTQQLVYLQATQESYKLIQATFVQLLKL